MIINLIIAALAFLLAGLFPFAGAGFISFILWAAILYVLAGVTIPTTITTAPDGTRRWWI